MEAVPPSHLTHLWCPHNQARACHAVSRANDDKCRPGVVGKSVCPQHTPRVTNVIHGTISTPCASLPRHTGRYRWVLEQACFHAELPEWVCAGLRSLTTATNLVSWPKASFGGSVLHERGFRRARRRECSAFPEPDCVRSARKGWRNRWHGHCKRTSGSRPSNGSV